MIHESFYWKQPLLKTAKWLAGLHIEDKTRERSFVRVEKELFIGFYAIRKLLDTYKVTDKTKAKSFNLKWSPLKGQKPGDYFNWHRIDEHYDLSERHTETRNIRFLCDQFIHSFVFIPAFTSRGKLSGFYLSSDRARHKRLYFVEIKQVLSAFQTVGQDNPREMRATRDPKTGQFECAVR
jgi:hypothetical protein